jgi:hypothetical protein
MMDTTVKDLCNRAAALGLRLEPRGDRLAVIPGGHCPLDLADALRRHKDEVLALLQAKAANLPPDCAPWFHVAKQVLTGEFDGADKSTIEALTIGLRGIPIPLCQQALSRLSRNPQKPAVG